MTSIIRIRKATLGWTVGGISFDSAGMRAAISLCESGGILALWRVVWLFIVSSDQLN